MKKFLILALLCISLSSCALFTKKPTFPISDCSCNDIQWRGQGENLNAC